jgi:hypothetical protein
MVVEDIDGVDFSQQALVDGRHVSRGKWALLRLCGESHCGSEESAERPPNLLPLPIDETKYTMPKA